MRKNVIILTSGLSGSSVLTGLIARAGYWTGEETFKKRDYETFENARLIELNLRLFKEAGYKGNYLLEFSEPAMNSIASLGAKVDRAAYRSFIEHCNEHAPWVWKDPRLWLTIRFWRDLLDLDQCRFILLTRGPMQSWISSTLRRQITTYRYSRNYERKIKESILAFFADNKLSHLHLQYETLISDPAAAIDRLNRHLDTSLMVDDLKAVYHKPLYKSPRNSWAKHVKAMLIYLKNYSERLDIAVEQ
jgi:hypothetical protein